MRAKGHAALLAVLATVSSGPALALAQTPVGSAFTYQGQLKQAGSPFTGTVDFDFVLWADPNSVNPVHLKGLVTVPAHEVTNGLFTVELDFGTDVFIGEARWLEIVVDGIPLSPRQELTPAPFALYALDVAGGGGSCLWDLSGSDIYYNDGRVGVGTNDPRATLHIAGTSRFGGERMGAPPDTDGDYLAIEAEPNQTGWATLRFDQAQLRFWNPNAGELMRLTRDGNVGIRVTDPDTRLAVNGDIALPYSAAFRITNQDFGSRTILRTGWAAEVGDYLDLYTPGDRVDGDDPRVRITSQGHVGINTLEPGTKLDVNGTITTTGLTLTTGAEAGHVLTSSATGWATWQAPGGGGGASTLDEAYDGGGAGAGRVITADAGAVEIQGPDGLTVAGTIQGGNSITIDGSSDTITSTNDLELHVSSGRALRIEPDATSPNIIAGHGANSVTGGVHGVTIAGGGNSTYPNTVDGHYGTVAGGRGNDAGAYDTIGGGLVNEATGGYATIGGGWANHARGASATVPGGRYNEAGGDYSFAAGYRAKVRDPNQAGDADGDEGTFVWADSTDADFASTGPDQFLIRATGGVGIGTTTPGTALDVNGLARVQDDSWPASGAGMELAYHHASPPATPLGYIQVYDRDTSTWGDLYLGDGNVGIGTTTPAEQMHVYSGSGATVRVGGDSDTDDAELQLFGNSIAGSEEGIALEWDGDYLNFKSWDNGVSDSTLMRMGGYSGRVGIGGDHTPLAPLHVEGIARMTGLQVTDSPQIGYVLTCTNTYGVAGWQPPGEFTLPYSASVAASGTAALDITNSGVGSDTVAVRGFASATSGTNYGLIGVSNSPDGYAGYFQGRGYFSGTVGIGMTEPLAAFHVCTDDLALTTDALENDELIVEAWDAAIGLYSRDDGTWGSAIAMKDLQADGTLNDTWGIARKSHAGGSSLHITYGSSDNYALNPTRMAISADGTTSVSVLEITGGSDLSEQFDVNAPDAEPQPGMVVCIDPESPGQLVVSTKACDRTVAGIISGAGGVQTGMLMGQKDSAADGKYPVALTGRVYVHCDTSNGPIQPGDLLTTSDSPGHAMRVTDHAKAQGAIIGKAMTSLQDGEGLVLVLVSLQ